MLQFRLLKNIVIKDDVATYCQDKTFTGGNFGSLVVLQFAIENKLRFPVFKKRYLDIIKIKWIQHLVVLNKLFFSISFVV